MIYRTKAASLTTPSRGGLHLKGFCPKIDLAPSGKRLTDNFLCEVVRNAGIQSEIRNQFGSWRPFNAMARDDIPEI